MISNNEHQQYDDTVWCHGLDHSHHSMYPCIIPFHLSLTSLFVTLSTFTVLWRHNLHQHDDALVFHGLHHITMSPYHAVFSSSRPPRGKSTQIQTQKHNYKKMHKYLNTHIQIQNNSTPCFQSHIHHIEKIPKYKNTDCTISFPQWIEAQGHHVEKVRDRLLTHNPTTKQPK